MSNYKLDAAEKRDVRETLYWNGNAQIDGTELLFPNGCDYDEDSHERIDARRAYAHKINSRQRTQR